MTLRHFYCFLFVIVSYRVNADYQGKLLETSQVWEATIADFNHDGHDDILINGHDPNDRIWYWTDSGYKASAQVFEYVDRHGCDAADVNQDGLLDLYCVIGADKGTARKTNELYLQRPNGFFALQKNGFGAEDHYGRGRRPLFFNFNHDKRPDLYVTDWAVPRIDNKPNINSVYINKFNTKKSKLFTAKNTIASGKRGSLCVAKGDFNKDGWDDLAVCDKEGIGHLYANNQRGDFQNSTPLIFRGNPRWQDAKLNDINNDGLEDLIILTENNYLQILLNQGTGVLFGVVSYQSLLPFKAMSVVIGDFSLDGIKDLYVVLQDTNCLITGKDAAPDILYVGTGVSWKKQQLSQNYQGCGYLADVLDGHKILLMNGGDTWQGPNYLIQK